MLLQDNTIIDSTSYQSPSLTQSPSTRHIFQQPQGQRIRSASGSNSYAAHHHNSAALTTPPLHSGGIRKKRSATTSSRQRSISTSYAERLHHIALEQSVDAEYHALQQHHHHHQQQQQQSSLNWLTPQHSPEPSCFFPQEPVPLEQYNWAVPTPPRSDSGIPSLPADIAEESQQPTCSGVSSPEIFAFEQAAAAASDMSSSLGFLLPQQYANASYTSSESNNGSYTQPTTAAPAPAPQYGQSISSSPSLYQSRPVPVTQPGRRQSDLPTPGLPQQMYASTTARRLTGPYDSPASSDYSMPQNQIPPIGSMPLGSPMTSPAPSASVMAPQYGSMSRSPAMYDSSQYYGAAYTSAPGGSQMYAPASSAVYPPTTYPGSSGMDAGRPTDPSMRAMNQKPKPQCWDHGCNGRQFSTFSNLLRHQREKSGTATKSSCPKCGAEFTRTTARNGHMAHDKCTKGRRPSEDGR